MLLSVFEVCAGDESGFDRRLSLELEALPSKDSTLLSQHAQGEAVT